LDGSTPLYAKFLATDWDGQVTIDDLRFMTSSTVAEQVIFLTLRVAPSAYNTVKGFRVIEYYEDTIDTLDQISAEFMLKVYKPAGSSPCAFGVDYTLANRLDQATVMTV
jgi:hypothetical protein